MSETRDEVPPTMSPPPSAPPAASATAGSSTSGPPTIGTDDPPRIGTGDDSKRRLRPKFYTGRQGWPQAQIDHGKAGDDHLHRHYKKYGTYSGAVVYVKPECDANNKPVSSQDNAAVVSNKRKRDADPLSDNALRQSDREL